MANVGQTAHQPVCHMGQPQNAKFVSPFPDERAWATDALAILWSGMWAYAFPLIPLTPLVLRKIKEGQDELILVAHWWPTKLWIPQLIELSLATPWTQPAWEKLLAQPRSSIFHDNPRICRLHAWRLLQRALIMPDSQRRAPSVVLEALTKHPFE